MDDTLKKFVIDGGERSVQDIVSKLLFISKIREGEKINISRLTLCQDNWSTKVYRTLGRESRCSTLEFIREVFGEAFDLSSKYLNTDNKFYRDIGTMILTNLQKSKAGLTNLTKTYAEDRMFISKIETLTSTLETKYDDILRQTSSLCETEISKFSSAESRLSSTGTRSSSAGSNDGSNFVGSSPVYIVGDEFVNNE